jgi:hypothetical protein
MARHKATLEFKATTGNSSTAGSQAGWTESWYDPVDSSDATSLAKTQRLRIARQTLLTMGWSVLAMRISQLDAGANLTRRGVVTFVAPADQPGTNLGGANPSLDEQPYDCLIVSVNSVGGHHRAFGMRGIAQNVISAGGGLIAPATFFPAFNRWLAALKGNEPGGDGVGWAIKYRLSQEYGNVLNVKFPEPPDPAFGDPQHPTMLVQMTPAAPAPTVNTFVNVKNVLGVSRINATWMIQKVTPQVAADTYLIQLHSKRRVKVGGQYVSGGDVEMWAYGLDNILIATPGYGSSRRTGRPPILVRGRRSNRAL